MILNRRTLLASIGLALPAVAAEAATTTAKKKKTPSHHVTKASATKRHKPHASVPAQS